MLIVHAERGKAICLGREGENLARQVVFDLYEWQELYGDGTVQLIAQRMGDTAPYPCVIEMDGNHAVWTITNADTARPGNYGKCELSYFVGETLVKSEIFVTIVLDAMCEPSEEAPEPYQAWVDKILAAGSATEAAADRAEAAVIHQPIIGENGNWWVWDTAAEEYVDTGVVAKASQSDWNQSDPDMPDYIKNRPFYEETATTEIFPETALEYDADMDMFPLPNLEVVVGDTYIVTWNGTEYECVATEDEYGDIIIGSSDYPFLIDATLSEAYSTDGSTEATLRIVHKGEEVVHPIDLKFLPEEVVTADELDTAINEKKVKWADITGKPFSESEYLLSETTIEIDGNLGGCRVDFVLIPNQTYFVTLDGVEYELVAEQHDDECVGLATDVFGIEQYDDNQGRIDVSVTDVDYGSVTLSIRSSVGKINSECLPTETWTFTLEDGTVIEKKVVVAT